MQGSSSDSNAPDPFTKFWSDMMSSMSPMGMNMGHMNMGQMGGSVTPQDEMFKQARRAFLDAWGQQCEKFMGSEPFLEAMRQSMDQSIAFKQQLNDFLKRTLHDNQMPTRDDTDSIVEVLRSAEQRVMDRLDTLSQRVEALEAKVDSRQSAETSSDTNSAKRKRSVKGGAN